MAKTKALICPYCGVTQPVAERCRGCGGLFETLSRRATHNAMGPWFVRDPERPFQPGCSYETLVKMVARGNITKLTVLRGPTTRQFWTIARRVPGVAHLLGHCHGCNASVDPDEHACHACGAQFGAYLDRNYMGLPEVRALPWEARMDDDEASSGYGLGDSRRVAGGGLSRFASDEELLAPAAFTTETAVVEPSGGRLAEARAATSPLEDHATSALTRALQRRIEGQKRSIRVLSVLTLFLALVAVVSNAAPLMRMFSSGDENAVTADPPTAQPRVVAENRRPNRAPPEEAAQVEPAPAPPLAPDAEVADGNDRYDEALRRLVAAEQTQRAFDERIGDYEAAVKILETLADGPPETRPAGLGELIDRAARELERLRLKDDFFGE